jgi:hypothetical protein
MLIQVVDGKITSAVRDTLEVAVAFSLEIWERVHVQFCVCAVKLAFALVQQYRPLQW